MLSSTKKNVRTYSRQSKRPLYDGEPAAKRRRVEDDAVESILPATPLVESLAATSSPTRISSARSSSPAPRTFSDTPTQSSPPSSDAPTRSSPPTSPGLQSSPPPDVRRRPVFLLFKRKLKHSVSAPEVLSERSEDAPRAPKPPPAKKKRMVQMQLDLVGQHRKACKACGMEYIPSNAEDVALHRKFHAVNFGGVDCTKAMVERLRQKQVWSGGNASFIAVVGRKDALALRHKARDVLKVVNTELAAIPILDEELWSQTTLSVDEEAKTAVEKCDRFKVYLYVRGQKCVGACLAERIQAAFTVLGHDTASGDAARVLAESSSSSISVSTTSEEVLLGISRIWVSSQFRKQGVARRLLDCTRGDFMYGLRIEKRLTAFSQPTESGGKLARQYFGREAGWHVYMDGGD